MLKLFKSRIERFSLWFFSVLIVAVLLDYTLVNLDIFYNTHRVIGIKSFEGLKIESLMTRGYDEINEGGTFTYHSFIPIFSDLPLRIYGTINVTSRNIWVLLVDIYGWHYVQCPKVFITRDGKWRMDNLRPLREITFIRIVEVDEYADSILEGRCEEGKFEGFKPDFTYRVLGEVELANVGPVYGINPFFFIGLDTVISIALVIFKEQRKRP